MATNRALHRREANDTLVAVENGQLASELESETLEFKEWKPPASNDRDLQKVAARDLADAVACLGNARGGTVIVGVANSKAGRGAFVGVPEDIESGI